MKMLVLYRQRSADRQRIEEFIRSFQSRNREVRIEILDTDSREGAAMASIYDIMQHPSIMVIRDDGALISSWHGSDLPLIDEVAAYARS